MADITVVDYEAFSTCITKFKTCKEQASQAVAKMDSVINSLDATWDGAASQAAVNKFNAMKANLMTSDATIEQGINGLEKAVAAYQAANEAASQAMAAVTEASSPFAG